MRLGTVIGVLSIMLMIDTWGCKSIGEAIAHVVNDYKQAMIKYETPIQSK
jgi:hypothetical protein